MRATTVLRTLLDIAPMVSPRLLAVALHRARVEQKMPMRELLGVMERAPKSRGLRRLHAVAFGDRLPPNRRERRFLQIVRAADQLDPERNAELWVAGVPYLVDFLWREQRLIYEIDDLLSHGTSRALVDDRRRDNALGDAGYRVRRLTDEDLWPRAHHTIARLIAQLRCDSP